MGRAERTKEEVLAIETRYVQIEKLRKLLVRMMHYAKGFSNEDYSDPKLFGSYMNDQERVKRIRNRMIDRKKGSNSTNEFKYPLLSTNIKKEFNKMWKLYKPSPTLYEDD